MDFVQFFFYILALVLLVMAGVKQGRWFWLGWFGMASWLFASVFEPLLHSWVS